MRRILLFTLGLLLALKVSAQDVMIIHRNGQVTDKALLSHTDSVYFDSEGTVIRFVINGALTEYPLASIDSITFGQSSDTVSVVYGGSSVTVDNPLAFDGVSVAVTGAQVTVTSVSETKDIVYRLSGVTSDGGFRIYSEKRFDLVLDGLSLTNAGGPAINIQSGKNVTVVLPAGVCNTLADGTSYDGVGTGPDGSAEQQDAAFYSEGKVIFTGTGALTLKGNGSEKHALFSEETIEVANGVFTVSSAAADGLHGKKGVLVSGGSVSVTATGDAIDGGEGFVEISGGSVDVTVATADTKGITCDSTLTVSGGSVHVAANGNQSKGIHSKQAMTLSGGTISLTTGGSPVLAVSGSGYDPSYCTGIRSDAVITLDGATVTITGTGKGNRGISSDAGISVLSGTLTVTESGAGATYTNSTGTTDAYGSVCISSDAAITLRGGTITLTNSGSAGRGISAGTLTVGDGGSPAISVTTTGSKITLSGSGQNAESAEAKAIRASGAVVISNGSVTVSSTDDGIKSATSVTLGGGTLSIVKSVEGIEAPAITVESGTVGIVASDDAFNATKGNGGESNDGSLLTLNGGDITVNTSGGDGLDSNGSIAMNGGTVVVHGPQSNPEVGMDYNGTCNVNGGLLVISGTNSNMTQAPSTTSSQYGIKVTTNSALAAATLFNLQDASGNSLVTFQPVRSYYSVVFSSAALVNGASYSVYTGGSCSGTNHNGLYTGGSYSGGSLKKTFTVSGKITNVSF